MNRLVSHAILICLPSFSGLASAIAAEPRPDVTFFVAPDGHDDSPGTFAQPFRTLSHAREAVRAAKERVLRPASITVEVRGGLHFMPVTLALARMDSGKPDLPIVYRAWKQERPVLLGGLPLSGFKRSDTDPQTWEADLAAVRFQGQRFKTLFRLSKDGHVERLTPARYPNAVPADPIRGGWASVAAAENTGDNATPAESKTPSRLSIAPTDRRQWSSPSEGSVIIFAGQSWWNTVSPISGFDRTQNALLLGQNPPQGIRPGDRFYVEGLREELDSAGEWYLDEKAKKLYVRPPKDVLYPADLTVVVPMLRSLVTAHVGVGFVTLSGLTLTASEGTAILMEGVTSCTIAGCTVTQVGDTFGSGITIILGQKNLITGCDVSQTGAAGIVLAGRNRLPFTPSGDRIVNTHVRKPGVISKQGAGIAVGGCGNVVERNLVHDCPRMGIMVGGFGHRIEGNIVRHTNQETEGAGAIMVAGRNFLAGHGTRVVHNVVEHTGGLRRDPNGEWVASENTWGILLDTHASGVDVIGNVIGHAARAAVRVENGNFNRIENNVLHDAGRRAAIELASWPKEDPRWARDLQEHGWVYEKASKEPSWQSVRGMDATPAALIEAAGTTFRENVIERNVLSCAASAGLAFAIENVPLNGFSCDHNVVWTGALDRRPSVSVEPPWPNTISSRPEDSFAEWQARGNDAHSLLVDPMLAETGSWMVPPPDSPASRIGFHAIPTHAIGPYADKRRATWPLVDDVEAPPLENPR